MATLRYTKAKYSVTLALPMTPDKVFSHLLDLAKWWPEDYIGGRIQPGVEFVLQTGDGHRSTNKVVAFVPDKTFTWLTTESKRKADGYDWSGTKFIFELSPVGDTTQLTFTYDGVVLDNEVEKLARICDSCIKDLFYDFAVNGKAKSASFTTSIEVTNSPDDIFQRITADVPNWWGGKDFSGKSTQLEDEFIIDHPGAHYSKQRLVEVVPGKKLAWLVTDSKLTWLKDQAEWTGTKMIFEISARPCSWLLHFTHDGLVPEKESYSRCSQGWNMVINDWLYTLIMYGRPHF